MASLITIDWQDVVDVAAELASLPVGTQDMILAALPLQMNEDLWGAARVNNGATYLAAHYGTLARRRGAAGGVAGQTAGGVSRTMQAAWKASPFASTSYGVIYEQLIEGLAEARFDVA